MTTVQADSMRGLFRELAERSKALRQDLARENERLTTRVAQLETDLLGAERAFADGLDTSKTEHERLSREALTLAEENLDLAKRYADLEEHATGLANLYAATFQLHATLDPDAVVQTVSDIAINLIGAAEFALYVADEARGDWFVACREGDLPPKADRLTAFTHVLEREAADERRTVFDGRDAAARDVRSPICCTPLFFRDRLVGILTIYALLSHKKSFSELDRKLFDLVGEQAAVALVSSQCYVSVDRKLKTVQRVIDLIKS